MADEEQVVTVEIDVKAEDEAPDVEETNEPEDEGGETAAISQQPEQQADEIDVKAEDEAPDVEETNEPEDEGGETAAISQQPEQQADEVEPAKHDGEDSGSEDEQAAADDKKPAPAEQTAAEPEAEPAAVEAVVEAEAQKDEAVKENGEAERLTSPPPGVDIHVGEYLQLMQAGTDLQKIRKSKAYPRIYRLESDLLGVTWNSRSKKGSKARIAIKQIQELRRGRSTDSFKTATHAAVHSEENCFSLIYVDGGKHHTLDLVAMSRSDADAWVLGLGTLIKEMDTGTQRSRVRERWLRDLFEDADRNGDGTLDLKEVIAMMRRLNVGVSKKVIKKKFEAADTEGSDQKLDFEEFCGLFKEFASRPEVKRLFHLYSSKKEWLTAEDLQKFLQLEQGMDDVSVEDCSRLIGQYEATDQGKVEGLMSIDGFTNFLLGPENDLFNLSHCQVYQDMSQPLSEYHIASSHNTYLLEDQLRGPSSVEAYIRALQKGCRCVELDCWDGEDGEPIIFHGHTLTSKILFKDVIVAIKEHAFKTSPYPVILSIENHCSIPQQTKMAEYFEDILGEMLCKQPISEHEAVLPSPETLKGKILIKGKKLSAAQEDADDGEVSDEDEAAEVNVSNLVEEKKETQPAAAAGEKTEEGEVAEGKKEGEVAEGKKEGEGEGEGDGGQAEGSQKNEGQEATQAEATATPEDKPSEAVAPSSPSDPFPKTRTFSFRRKKPPAPAATGKSKKKVKLSTKLSKCINYVQSVHFKGFDDWGEDGKFFQMSSFGESSAVKHSSRNNSTAFMMYNKRQLSRIYPSGRRVDSSNYNPVDMWNSGCQIVALNYQTQDIAMDLNDGKFQQNGRSGYILKPRVQREESARFDFHGKVMPGLSPKLYTITVISGQTLPKPPGGSKTGEVIDPYIVINTHGRPEDQHMFKTKTISDNGFNPVWNQTFSFVVQAPDYTYIRFKVMDEDWGPNADDFIGQFSAPLESIMSGYRHIHLNCSGSPLENSSLFIHVAIMDYIGATPKSGKAPFKTRKNREYPASCSVGLPSIDTVYQAAQPRLRRAVDMREDYIYGLVMFKESCGHGPHAVISDCVQLMAARAKASNVSIFLDVVGKTEGTQTYKAGYPSDATPPQTLVVMVTSFNLLNQAIQSLVSDGNTLSEELKKVYKECSGLQGDLKTHLQSIGANSRKINQTMEHFGYITCTLTFVADRLSQCRESATSDLQKIVSAAQKYEIEMKTTM